MKNPYIRDLIKTLIILATASIITYGIKSVGEAIDIVVVVYMLSVLLVSRFTNGYLWGILASVFSVLATNFIFTMPYFQFNFMMTGYPIAFAVMLATSIMTSALTSNYKKQKEAAEAMNKKLQDSYEEQRAIERAAEKEKMKNNLLRAISHDLRTPLTSISGASSVILENGDQLSPETCHKLIMDIQNESQWLIRMVENLLSITHISEETMKVHKVPQVAEEIIAGAISHFNTNNYTKKILVNVPDELIIVPMDATLIEQVIINLIDNAEKHSVNSTTITVNLRSKNNNAIFEIKDDGQGISDNDIKYLFEYGESKGKNISTDSNRGFGIGLPTCRTIIHAHSGEIQVESEIGKGTCFSFTLPMEEDSGSHPFEDISNPVGYNDIFIPLDADHPQDSQPDEAGKTNPKST